MSYKVFIGSTRADLALAQDLAQRLKAVGVQVAPVKKTTAIGDEVPGTVNPALREADEVIFIMTNEAGDNPGLLTEIGMAFGMKKRVTPVVVHSDPKRLPSIAGWQPVRYADLTKYIAQLAERVKPDNGD